MEPPAGSLDVAFRHPGGRPGGEDILNRGAKGCPQEKFHTWAKNPNVFRVRTRLQLQGPGPNIGLSFPAVDVRRPMSRGRSPGSSLASPAMEDVGEDDSFKVSELTFSTEYLNFRIPISSPCPSAVLFLAVHGVPGSPRRYIERPQPRIMYQLTLGSSSHRVRTCPRGGSFQCIFTLTLIVGVEFDGTYYAVSPSRQAGEANSDPES